MDILWKLFSQTYVGTKSSCKWCHKLLRGCPLPCPLHSPDTLSCWFC